MRSLRKISFHYLRTWLLLDLLALLPSAFDIYFAAAYCATCDESAADGGSNGSDSLRAAKTVKMSR